MSLVSEIDRFPLAPGGGGVVGGGGGVAAGSGLADLPRVERNLRQLMDAGAQLFAKTDNVQVSSIMILVFQIQLTNYFTPSLTSHWTNL